MLEVQFHGRPGCLREREGCRGAAESEAAPGNRDQRPTDCGSATGADARDRRRLELEVVCGGHSTGRRRTSSPSRSTVPDVPSGDIAVIDVGELTVKLVASAASNSTAITCVKLVPVIVTAVPPVAGPFLGDTLTTVGCSPGASVVNDWSAP